MTAVIAAVAKNGVIGANGTIPWNIPEDRAYFRRLTMGGAVIMGRLTYESIGRPLPGRLNIVVSRSTVYKGAILRTAGSTAAAVAMAERGLRRRGMKDDVFLCGGSGIYREGIALADRLYITELYDDYCGDTYFPEQFREGFELLSCDDRPELRLRFCVYIRKNGG
ncbi:MAG: dihydrofolate reductase [Ruminococcus sp.]|nr:dihydrofolate reductase [Ruminococcus sp.]